MHGHSRHMRYFASKNTCTSLLHVTYQCVIHGMEGMHVHVGSQVHTYGNFKIMYIRTYLVYYVTYRQKCLNEDLPTIMCYSS